MDNYNSSWPPELKRAEQLRFRAECRLRCLTAALDRTDPEDFDRLMDQIEQAQQELRCAADAKFEQLLIWAQMQTTGGI